MSRRGSRKDTQPRDDSPANSTKEMASAAKEILGNTAVKIASSFLPGAATASVLSRMATELENLSRFNAAAILHHNIFQKSVCIF